MKIKSDQAAFSFLDLILLIQASSVDSELLWQEPTWHSEYSFRVLYMNPDLSALLTYKLNLEQRVVLAAEISWDRNKTTITYYVNESDPHSNVHYLGSSGNKALKSGLIRTNIMTRSQLAC